MVTAWGVTHPWPTREQIEQDMLLSKAICDIFSNNSLAGELVFRGGTALHKLLLPQPYRYSEDLDFVRMNAGGIGSIMKELTELGKASGFSVSTKMNQYPKVYWRGNAQTGRDIKIKIEINTYERSPALPLTEIEHSINSDWFSGNTLIRVFQNEEIAATKIRALYQRAKGRDLFDLWLMTNELSINRDLVYQAFLYYRPVGFTSVKAIENLEKKLNDEAFRTDIFNLVSTEKREYNIETAANEIIEVYLANL
jgi:predicted nucleotidyltransferase component of viral defense system